ncbi:hypothetical protein TELCIR_04240 [Teladorsagia circumcincta]|uniref:Uncharacterized protein n=1 Tax=Teladorsagia circumcincta TaxID=45464 RepID=A0A2G9UU74_TELCI|nr:hypothetical protein TELCIR_04240 [Teladorsagia circumcincta]
MPPIIVKVNYALWSPCEAPAGLASDVGDFFTKQFNNVKDLFANNQSELEKNIQRVKDLLMAIKEKAKMLEPMANDAQKKTISEVNNYMQQVDAFGAQVSYKLLLAQATPC